MSRKLIVVVIAWFAYYSSQTWALGLGDIELSSALNQPFDATIKLISNNEAELEGLRVGLASNADFERIGAVRSPFLNGLKFEIITPERGKPYIKVSSTQPIREPFVDFILEANWPAGRLLREYTVLLDPPTITTERAAPVQAPSVSQAAASQPSPPTPAPVRQTAPQSPTGIIQPTTTASVNGELVYGPTKSSDTLWNIASSLRPNDSVSVQQMMIALLKENPNAFEDNNINNLKAGEILRIENESVITELTHRQAVNEAARQYQEWLAAKEARLAARGEVASQELAGTAEDAESTAAGSPSVIAESAPEGGLRLLADDALEDGTTQGGVTDVEGGDGEIGQLREDLELTTMAAEAAREQNAELRERLVALEEQISAMQRALQLKDDTLTQLQQKLGTEVEEDDAVSDAVEVGVIETLPFEEETQAEVIAEVIEPASETVADEADVSPEDAAPVAEETPEPTDTAAPGVVDNIVKNAGEIATSVKESVTGLVADFSIDSVKEALQPDNILQSYRDNSLIYRVVSGIVLVLLILGIVVRRRRAAAEEQFEEFTAPRIDEAKAADDGIEEITDDEFGLGDTEEATMADVLSEVDVYISYQRYDKAETVLKHAIDNEPGRVDLKAKLLEVYHRAKNVPAFVAAADEYYAALSEDESLWSKINDMGLELAPDHHLFSNENADSAEFDSIVGFDELSELDAIDDEQDADDSDDYADIDLEMELFGTEEGGAQTAEADVVSDDAKPSLTDEAKKSSQAKEIVEDVAASHDEEPQGLESEFEIETDLGLSEDSLALVSEDDAEPADLELAMLPLELDKPSTTAADTNQSLLERAMDNANNGESSREEFNDKYGSTNLGDEDDFDTPIGAYDLDTEMDADADYDPSTFAGVDVVSTKLDLAKAYIDMGDQEGARSILSEVVAEGNDAQKTEAQELIEQL